MKGLMRFSALEWLGRCDVGWSSEVKRCLWRWWWMWDWKLSWWLNWMLKLHAVVFCLREQPGELKESKTQQYNFRGRLSRMTSDLSRLTCGKFKLICNFMSEEQLDWTVTASESVASESSVWERWCSCGNVPSSVRLRIENRKMYPCNLVLLREGRN